MNDTARFAALKQRLPEIWTALSSDSDYEHTSVIVPSLSVNQEELAKVTGAAFYEERLLFGLIRLRNPNAHVVYVTSQPVHPDIIDYYLDMLETVPLRHARDRLHMLSVLDSSARPLSDKILERPRFLERMRRLIGDPRHAYLTCYNSTPRERQLALALGVPLNGLDPDHLVYGTKSGNRQIFAEAGVRFPAGRENLRSEEDIVDALAELARERPDASRAVVKLNEGFGGEGNGVFEFPAARDSKSEIRVALARMHWTSGTETTELFLRKLEAMGGIVEELVVADEVRSPSVQMRITPNGEAVLVSSHEQVLGGATGQSYLGCRFPADDAYRKLLLEEAEKIGRVLAARGVLGRFGIDFLACRDRRSDNWGAYAIEINLRMGGTTPPFMALQFLTGGGIDGDTGLFLAPDGTRKYYSATDNLKSAAYRGLLPEDLFEIVARKGLGFRHASGTGALFHMIGALSQYGKIGMTCVADSPADAQAMFDRTVVALDDEIDGRSHAVQVPLLDRYYSME
ncbi:MAG: peptide ligase PGM1-related protein [Gammaproteobacteria bacterium]|nr:peptide ligase PGM1-related protein [Gammaproteobacteria bacterium]